jgi:hypothetical protein
MKFSPEQCRIKDQRMVPFLDPDEIWDFILTAQILLLRSCAGDNCKIPQQAKADP